MSGNPKRSVKLGDLFAIKHGYAFKGEHFGTEGSHIVLTPGNFFDEGGFKKKGDKEKWYSGKIPADYILSRGDLIVAMTEQGEGLLGSAAIVPESSRYLHNQRLGLIQNLNAVNKRFLYYLFNSHPVRQQIRASCSGVKVRHTSPSRIYDVKVDIPPLPTQRKIAAVLTAYDNLIENNLRRIKILEEMAQNLYREWFVKFRFPGHQRARFVDSPLGRIPEGWKLKLLRNFITVDKGISYKGEFLTNDGIPMVNLKCIPPGGGFNRHGTKPYAGVHKSRHRVVSGDLVFANTDLTQAGNIIGSPGLVPRCGFDQGGLASHHICIVRVGKHSPVGKMFLFHLLQSGGFREFAKGCASGTTVLGFRSDDALAFEFVLPPQQLTERFEQIASDLYDLGESLNDRNTTLRRTRDLLSPRLISGEVDMSELDITIPEELSA